MNRINFIISFFLTISFVLNAQEKRNYSSDILDLGDGKILSSNLNESRDFVIQEFMVEVQQSSKYYLAAWVNGGLDLKGEKIEFIVHANNGKTGYKMKAEKNSPHAVELKDETINLNAGVNTIAIKTLKPECPNVEFVKVSLDKENCSISYEKYSKYIDKLSRQNLPDNYLETKKALIEEELANSKLKSYELPNPEGNYDHEMDLDFGYAFYNTYYLFAGNTYTFETKNANCDPVLHLFKKDAPTQYSWTDDDGGDGTNSKITATITTTGHYYLLIRKYSATSSSGICDLYRQGTLYESNCPVSGSRITCDETVNETLNWFTADLTGDSRIWIENQNGTPGKIIAYNDDWTETSDFSWGHSSRICTNLNTSIKAVIVSCFSSYNPTGNCDLYMNCQNSNDEIMYDLYGRPYTICEVFPSLKSNDAIESAPQSGVYNCISWSVGIFEDWSWPSGFGSSFSVVEDFYENYGYTATGANSSNSVVDLWADDYSYTHASVTKPGNNHPHGYDWESKPGDLMRTFHPRNSLEGDAYGEVVDYFIESGGLKSTSLLAEKIANGTDVIENVEFTSAEDRYIKEKVNSLDNKEILEEKYTAWKNTWKNPDIAVHSNPRKYAESEEYDEFIEYCRSEGNKVWPFIFEKFGQGQEEFMAINAIEDLTADTHKDLMQQILEGNKLKSTTESGAHIHRFPYCNTMKYIQAILKSTGEVTNVEDDGIKYSNSFDFIVYPNPATSLSQIAFDLPYEATVSVWLIDLNGKTISTSVSKETLPSGSYSYNLNIPDNAKGIYLVNFKVNNNYNVKRIVVQ